jgi:hypothetical protein
MCQLINAACLIANVFEVFPTHNFFQLSDIGRIGDRVEDALRAQNIAVDWTRPSVMEAFSLYSDLFAMGDGKVWKRPQFDEFSAARFVMDEFNYALSQQVVLTMRETIQQASFAA